MEQSDKYISYFEYVSFLRKMAVLLTDADRLKKDIMEKVGTKEC